MFVSSDSAVTTVGELMRLMHFYDESALRRALHVDDTVSDPQETISRSQAFNSLRGALFGELEERHDPSVRNVDTLGPTEVRGALEHVLGIHVLGLGARCVACGTVQFLMRKYEEDEFHEVSVYWCYRCNRVSRRTVSIPEDDGLSGLRDSFPGSDWGLW